MQKDSQPEDRTNILLLHCLQRCTERNCEIWIQSIAMAFTHNPGKMAQRWQGERKLFIKLLVEESKLSKKHEMEKEGTEKIGSEKLPIVYRVKGEMELRRFGMQG